MLRVGHAGPLSGQEPPDDGLAGLPDLLEDARIRAQERTSTHVVILSYTYGDFRLDGPLKRPTFAPGAGFTAILRGDRVYLEMDSCWYRSAARLWNGLSLPQGWSDRAISHLCAALIARQPPESPPGEEDIRLMRALMDGPHLLRRGSRANQARHWEACGSMLRERYARALACGAPLYALRGCACMLAALMGGNVPVRTAAIMIGKGEINLC